MRRESARLGIDVATGETWLAGLAASRHEPATLDALAAAGLVEPCTLAGTPAVTLTPAAAFHLGVELVEFGGDDASETRWQSRGRPLTPIKLRRRRGEIDQDRLALLAVWRGDADDELERQRVELVIVRLTGSQLRLFQGTDGLGAGVPVARDRRIKPAKGVKSKGNPARSKTAPKPTPAARPNPFAALDAWRAEEAAARAATGTVG